LLAALHPHTGRATSSASPARRARASPRWSTRWRRLSRAQGMTVGIVAVDPYQPLLRRRAPGRPRADARSGRRLRASLSAAWRRAAAWVGWRGRPRRNRAAGRGRLRPHSGRDGGRGSGGDRHRRARRTRRSSSKRRAWATRCRRSRRAFWRSPTSSSSTRQTVTGADHAVMALQMMQGLAPSPQLTTGPPPDMRTESPARRATEAGCRQS
jgi:hypothetical protein